MAPLRRPAVLGWAVAAFVGLAAPLAAQEWRTPEAWSRWTLAHDVAPADGPGFRVRATGDDPYLVSPPFSFESDVAPEVEIALRLSVGGMVQLFWSESDAPAFREEASTRFEVEGGILARRTVRLQGAAPWTGRLGRLRVDPGTTRGDVELWALVVRDAFEARLERQGYFGGTAYRIPRFLFRARVSLPASAPAACLPVFKTTDDFLSDGSTPPPDLSPLRPGERRTVTAALYADRDGVHVASLRVGDRVARAAIGSDGEGKGVFDDLVLADARGDPFRPRFFSNRTYADRFDHDKTAYVPGGAILVRTRTDEDRNSGAHGGERVFRRELTATTPLRVLNWIPIGYAMSLRHDVAPGGVDHLRRGRALVSGIEDLDAGERSSSDRSDRGPSSERFVADPLAWTRRRIEFQSKNSGERFGLRQVGGAEFSPMFASPDVLFGTNGASGGLVFPPVGPLRGANRMIADEPYELRAGETLVCLAKARGGYPTGRFGGAAAADRDEHSAVLSVEPERSAVSRTRSELAVVVARAVRLAPAAYLDSALYDAANGGYGHCAEPTWERAPSADLPAVMRRLLLDHPEIERADALRRRADDVLARVPASERLRNARTHARVRAAPFLAGGAAAALKGWSVPAWVRADETIERRVTCEGPLAESHWEKTSSGLVADAAREALEAAAFTGDAVALRVGLALTERLDRFEVPRGAQTWEVPLHAPDILAAANAVEAATLALKLTGETEHRDRARTWFLRGLPFVYDRSPTGGAIGEGATIAVLGATHYVAPNWIGLPVQWCGLRFAEALYAYAPHETRADLRDKALEIADAIFASAVAQLADDGPCVGCLPDSFLLRAQRGQGPWINPGSVHALLPDFERRSPLYAFARAKASGAVLHAPGGLTLIKDGAEGFVAEFRAPRGGAPYELAATGCAFLTDAAAARRFRVEGVSSFEVDPESRLVVFRVDGSATLRVRWDADAETPQDAASSRAMDSRPAASALSVEVDVAADRGRRSVVDRDDWQYLGHPSTLQIDDGRGILCVYPEGHGKGPIRMRRSDDGGRTWSDRLPTPENWATSGETPTLFRIKDPRTSRDRLVLWSGLRPARRALSDDEGRTWTPLEAAGDWGGIVLMSSATTHMDGSTTCYFHDDGRFFAAGGKKGRFTVYATTTRDGGVTWEAPRALFGADDVDLCEPGLVRSPDGKTLALLLRENRRQRNSHVAFSTDDGATWSTPRELGPALTGDRHVAAYAPDGRLVVVFRDMAARSETKGDFVAWVGTWDALVAGGNDGYRVRLAENLHEWDCGYAGLELLPNGTFVATTYGYWDARTASNRPAPPYVVAIRFDLAELDALRAAK
jgi:hypothetical protein